MPGLFDGTSLERPVTCPACAQVLADCACPRDAAGNVVLPRDQQVRVWRERRRGKWTTVAAGFDAHATDLPGLLKRLRTTCSAGGTVADDRLVVQGDHCDRVVSLLGELGYSVKRSGG